MDMKNIILDVDGTLWNTTDIVADSWTRALRTCDITDITVTERTCVNCSERQWM